MKRKKRASFGPAADHLSACDPDWAKMIARIGACGLAQKPEREPYQALIRAVAFQQLNGKAASAILGRFLALYPEGFPAPERILATDEAVMRGCGFSLAKIATIRGIAAKAAEGLVPDRAMAERMEDEALIERLVALPGIGRWTVEMLLIFNLGRPDILPVGDFGVREGWRVVKSLEEQPKPKLLAEIGRAWSPYRSSATWWLWRAAEQGRNMARSEVNS